MKVCECTRFFYRLHRSRLLGIDCNLPDLNGVCQNSITLLQLLASGTNVLEAVHTKYSPDWAATVQPR